MGTQAVVAVIDRSGKVLAKAVAGMDGQEAPRLAAEIRRLHLTKPSSIYEAALRVGFGHVESLVVQGPQENVYRGGDKLSNLYMDREKFQDPRFNPRWEHGTADHVELVQIGASKARKHRRAREAK